MQGHACFGTSSHPDLTCCVPPSHQTLGTRNYGPQTCVAECAFVCMCVCRTSYQTGAETRHLHPRHHLHSPFPACRVIPAPALPPLPSHTYQPPAAVPLPESGSSSLDILWTSNNSSSISLCVCFHASMHSLAFPLTCFLFLNSHLKGTQPENILTHYLSSCVPRWHIVDFRGLCKYILNIHMHKILHSSLALSGCYLTSSKLPIIFQRHVGCTQYHSLSTVSSMPMFTWDR